MVEVTGLEPSSPRSAEFSHCRQGNAHVRARRLLSPKISLASFPAIFGDPDFCDAVGSMREKKQKKTLQKAMSFLWSR